MPREQDGAPGHLLPCALPGLRVLARSLLLFVAKGHLGGGVHSSGSSRDLQLPEILQSGGLGGASHLVGAGRSWCGLWLAVIPMASGKQPLGVSSLLCPRGRDGGGSRG